MTFTDVDEPVYYGPNVASALDWVRGFTSTSNALKNSWTRTTTIPRATGQLGHLQATRVALRPPSSRVQHL